jgi:hypothetical protein
VGKGACAVPTIFVGDIGGHACALPTLRYWIIRFRG